LTMDRYTHLGLLDTSNALDKLPALPLSPSESNAEVLRATGTDATPARRRPRLDQKDAGRCLRMETHDNVLMEMQVTAGCRKSLTLMAVEDECDRLGVSGRGKAPPGFEPGMADLQSAALPLG